MQLNAIQLHSDDDSTKYCIPSLLGTVQSGGAVCETLESFDFGTSLQEVYPLLSSVFKHLQFADLESAKEVNDVWGRYADEELSKRNGASWVGLTKLKGAHFILERSTNFLYDDASFCLVFYAYKDVKLNKFVCLHGAGGTVRIPFAEYLTREVVPKGGEFWAFSCRSAYRIKEASSDGDKFRSLFSALLIPKIPDVTVRRFCASMKNLGGVLQENLDSDEVVDCMLVFTMSNPERCVPILVQKVLRGENADSIALCGGVVTGGIKLFNSRNRRRVYNSSQVYCLAFVRKRRVLPEFGTFSIVIQTEDEFEAKVSEFRRRTVLRKKSFIIRVCCAAKAETETETSLVYKYFPDTFVIGLDADGEVGWDKFIEDEEESALSKKKSKVIPESCHQYSTVLLLITWGPKL